MSPGQSVTVTEINQTCRSNSENLGTSMGVKKKNTNWKIVLSAKPYVHTRQLFLLWNLSQDSPCNAQTAFTEIAAAVRFHKPEESSYC